MLKVDQIPRKLRERKRTRVITRDDPHLNLAVASVLFVNTGQSDVIIDETIRLRTGEQWREQASPGKYIVGEYTVRFENPTVTNSLIPNRVNSGNHLTLRIIYPVEL